MASPNSKVTHLGFPPGFCARALFIVYIFIVHIYCMFLKQKSTFLTYYLAVLQISLVLCILMSVLFGLVHEAGVEVGPIEHWSMPLEPGGQITLP